MRLSPLGVVSAAVGVLSVLGDSLAETEQHGNLVKPDVSLQKVAPVVSIYGGVAWAVSATVDGQESVLQIDTGSADLWVPK